MTSETQFPTHDTTVRSHERWIKISTRVAWAFVVIGAIVAVPGLLAISKDGRGFLLLENLASYGSYLQGSVASLWSLAGLMFIYAAFLGQKQQLIQQDEELADQKHQFQMQHDSIKRQNFESSLFQLLNLQNQVLGAIKISDIEGKHAFLELRNSFAPDFQSFLRRKGFSETMNEVNLAIQFYEEFHAAWEAQLSPYFRTLYHIIKFIDLSEMPDKRRYTSLVRAQLSKWELLLLFYNCLSNKGKGFKPLVEKYGFLEHLDQKVLLMPDDAKAYSPNAYA